MEKYELQKLRDLPIEGVAERLGLHVSRHKALCPFHADKHPSLTFNTHRNTYCCYSCGAHGGVIDLAMKLLPSGSMGGSPFKEACEFLAHENNIVLGPTNPVPSCPDKKPILFDASRYQRYFERPYLDEVAQHFLYDERHLDPRVVRWCRLNSFRDRKGVHWLQIPYYDQAGQLIGVQSRNLDYQKSSPQGEGPEGASNPRFRFPAGSQCHLYNQQIIAMLQPGEPIYLCEGPSDTWAMLSSGHKAVGIPSATLLKPQDLLPLAGRECHIYPDADSAGEQLYQQLLAVSLQHRFTLVRHDLPDGCKDYGEYYVKFEKSH